MADEQTTTESTEQPIDQTRPVTGEAWREVGQHFQALGESLMSAFRAAWENEENRQHLRGVRASLETVVDKVSETIKEVAASPEVKQVRTEVEKAAQSAQTAGHQILDEARPHLLDSLRHLRTEVEKMIDRLEKEGPIVEGSATESSPDPQEPTE